MKNRLKTSKRKKKNEEEKGGGRVAGKEKRCKESWPRSVISADGREKQKTANLRPVQDTYLSRPHWTGLRCTAPNASRELGNLGDVVFIIKCPGHS